MRCSFLWSGWLYGREAARPPAHGSQRRAVELGLVRPRHGHGAAHACDPPLRPDGRLVLAFADRSPRRGLALLAAASAAGWRLVAQATQTPLDGRRERTQWRFELAPAESAVARTQRQPGRPLAAQRSGGHPPAHRARAASRRRLPWCRPPAPCAGASWGCWLSWPGTRRLPASP